MKLFPLYVILSVVQRSQSSPNFACLQAIVGLTQRLFKSLIWVQSTVEISYFCFSKSKCIVDTSNLELSQKKQIFFHICIFIKNNFPIYITILQPFPKIKFDIRKANKLESMTIGNSINIISTNPKRRKPPSLCPKSKLDKLYLK